MIQFSVLTFVVEIQCMLGDMYLEESQPQKKQTYMNFCLTWLNSTLIIYLKI